MLRRGVAAAAGATASARHHHHHHHHHLVCCSTLPCAFVVKFSPSTSPLPAAFASSELRPIIIAPRTRHMPPTRCYSSNGADESEGSGSSSTRASSRELYIQHLLVKQEDTSLILQLQQRIASGEDFDELVHEYSICPSKGDFGILGWLTKDQLDPEFAEVAFKAPLERVFRCKTRLGWHLVRVLGERDAPIKAIDPAELHQKMQDPHFFEEAQLIDVREPDEVSRASLPGFQVFPLRQFGTWGPDITTKLDLSKDTYVLCHHGSRSLQVAKWLQLQGFQSIYNVVGGIHAYAKDVDSSIPTY
uniref:Peptidylprolyl isomerase n=1 Tax=Kalanchoe fedtschenkoi TaxID=63787 RepID=A0A7N0THF7_KALFE